MGTFKLTFSNDEKNYINNNVYAKTKKDEFINQLKANIIIMEDNDENADIKELLYSILNKISPLNIEDWTKLKSLLPFKDMIYMPDDDIIPDELTG